MLKLFVELLTGDLFHYGDTPDTTNVKTGDTEYVGPDGKHDIHPHVVVIQDKSENMITSKGLLDRMKGDSDDHR